MFLVSERALVFGGRNALGRGTFTEMLALADRLDPDYARGLRVEAEWEWVARVRACCSRVGTGR